MKTVSRFSTFSPTRQIVSFIAVGAASTGLFILAYSALRAGLPAHVANAVALVGTNVFNTAANRAFTFRASSRHELWRDQIAGFGALGVALAITSASLAILHSIDAHASFATELAALTAAQIVAAVTRFYLLRFWFERHARVTVTRSPAH